jgi:hypothetical protein
MRLRALSLLLAGGLLLGACVGADASASPGPDGSSSATGSQPTATSPTPLASFASAVPSPPGPGAGLPYSANDVLEAMAGSRRPGGVPQQLQRDSLAAAIAGELWTFDADPWEAISVGGSCGPSHCTLEIGGSSDGSLGEDLYIFDVAPDAGEVSVLSAELRGMPAGWADELDGFARANWPDAPLPGPMTSARWLPPPNEGVYVLSYRSGGEENSPAVDAVIDLGAGSVALREPG